MGMLPRQFKTLVEMLRAELASIGTAVEDQSISTRDAFTAAHEDGKDIAARLRDLRTTENEKAEAWAFRKEQYRQQERLIRATWCAFGAAAVYALIAAWQLHSTNQTYQEIKLQTTLTRQQTIGTFAASMIVESPRPTPFADDVELLHMQSLYLYFANVGKIKASRFEAHAILSKMSLPGFGTLGNPQKRSIIVNQLDPIDQGPVGIPGLRTDDVHIRFDTHIFDKSDLSRLQSFREAVEIRGAFQYQDGFGNEIQQPFCFVYATFPAHTFSNGADTGGGEGAWGRCEDMRNSIAEAIPWRK